MKKMIKQVLSTALALLVSLAVFAPKAIPLFPLLFSGDYIEYSVGGTSMHPTLEDGQEVALKTHRETFDRGDIVVLRLPEAGYQFSEEKEGVHIIKRIIGLPGETVDIGADNTVRINGEILDEPYLTEEARNASYVPNREHHFELAENMYFVAGDNRVNSCDSRYFGCVEFEEIIGVFDPSLPASASLARDTLLLLFGFLILFEILSKILSFIFRVNS